MRHRRASLTVRLIPALDLKAGHCVRLLHGDFTA
jgi:phosphoribosylformimino-5-aminoimidazole carboxamide ribonucleotide (ProFAR) isomerase